MDPAGGQSSRDTELRPDSQVVHQERRGKGPGPPARLSGLPFREALEPLGVNRSHTFTHCWGHCHEPCYIIAKGMQRRYTWEHHSVSATCVPGADPPTLALVASAQPKGSDLAVGRDWRGQGGLGGALEQWMFTSCTHCFRIQATNQPT